MNYFTHKTPGYEQFPAYSAFAQFLDSYLVKRDYLKTSSMIDEKFLCVGTGEDEIAVDKEDFLEMLLSEVEIISKPIIYRVKHVCGKEVAQNTWDLLAGLYVVFQNEKDRNVYLIRFTCTLKLAVDGFRILSLHMSEPSNVTETKAFEALKHSDSLVAANKVRTQQVAFDLMLKTMPGGIVIGYAEEGFPLYYVNKQYLDLIGYSSYEEYYEAANGSGVYHIHPDDVEMVNHEIKQSYSLDKQYAFKYRIRHKDGHYISVYDIGKKIITPDHKEGIICVLYEMQENFNI
jgi:hypothetical protein